jgi:hypothetical protein
MSNVDVEIPLRITYVPYLPLSEEEVWCEMGAATQK